MPAPVNLDGRRGHAELKATAIRRLLQDVEADQRLRARQDALEAQLIAAPAVTWAEVADNARYLIGLLAASRSAVQGVDCERARRHAPLDRGR